MDRLHGRAVRAMAGPSGVSSAVTRRPTAERSHLLNPPVLHEMSCALPTVVTAHRRRLVQTTPA